jgi:DNA repair and recombination protein RAD54B
MNKPFRPPLLKSRPKAEAINLTRIPESDDESEINPRPYKKRKLLVHIVDDSPPSKITPSSSAVQAPRKPLLVVKNPSKPKTIVKESSVGLEGYYMVLWFVFMETLGYHRRKF